jgi:hypothetical protein
MPKYTLGLPDGRTIQIDADAPETAQKRASEWAKANPKPQRSLDNGPRVPQYAQDQSGEEVNLNAPEYENAKAKLAAENEANKQAEQKRLANRGLLQRGVDAASFALSVPVRMATGGDYGIGDLAGLVNENAGRNFKQSEGDFAKANDWALTKAGELGDLALGVPALDAIGVPQGLKGLSQAGKVIRPAESGGLGATLNTIRASPRGAVAGAVRNTGETLSKYSRTPGAVAGDEGAIRLPTAVGRAGEAMQSYANNMQPPQTKLKPQTPQTALPQNIQTIPERLADIQAFKDLELKPFGPATASQGVARGARTIEELPLIGGTVKSPKTDLELGFKERQAQTAAQLGDKGTEEATGAMVQNALERYRTKGISDLEPGVLKGNPVGPNGPVQTLNISPYQPVKASQIMSGGAAARAADADIAAARAAGGGGTATTARGATAAAAKPLDQLGLRRTNVEDLSEAELNRVIKAPSSQTSFLARSEALYESANKKLPPIMRKDGSKNPNMLATPNTRQALLQTQSEVGNQLGAGQGTVFGKLAADLINSKTNFSFDKLRAIRTEVGRALSNFGDYETRLDRTQLNRVYGSISRDMEVGLTDIANRAWERTRLDKAHNDYLSPEAAKRADAALYEFRRADRYFRQGMTRMEKFMEVLQAKTPNEAAMKISRALAEKTANPQMLRQIAGTLRPEELNALKGHIVASLGAGRPGGKAAETVMSWNNWGTDYHKIMDSAAGREFMTKGLNPEILKRWDNMARVANRMKYYEQTKNFSGSAYTGIIGAGAVALTNPFTIPKLALATLGIAGMGKLLTSAPYMAWQEAFMRTQLKVGNTAMGNARITAQYAKRLGALAKAQKNDPELAHYMQVLSVEMSKENQERDMQKARALPAPHR